MKRIATIASVPWLLFFLIVPARLAAQSQPSGESNHLQVGVFGDYFRYAPSDSVANFVGVGGRVGINVSRHAEIEGEMAYDFAKNYTTTFSGTNSGGATTNFVTVGVRPLTGLFGPKFDFGSPSAHLFLTGKVGFINWTNSNPDKVDSATFTNAVDSIGGSGTHIALYPGGGVEGFWGPIGVRLEAGDEIYVNGGTHNNLRATFGPVLRF